MSLSYRDIFKWGDKSEQSIDSQMSNLIKKEFGLSDEALNEKYLPGTAAIQIKPSSLTAKQLEELKGIAGAENVHADDDSRAQFAYGKFYGELLQLRKEVISSPPDAVVAPPTEESIIKIMVFCEQNNLPIIPSGGRSSVTRGTETPKGGIALDMTVHFNKILSVNETDQTVRVQSGMYGPAFETELNRQGYSCGHFPQSFEYSTVGGWIAAKGAGQASTGYGKIEDLTVALKAVTPAGVLETRDFPKSAQGWDIHTPFIGSEGSLGVITEATLKIFKHQPNNTAYAAFVFKSFEDAVSAMRLMIQNESGKPHLFRISDPAETDIAFRTKGFENSSGDKVLKMLGYKPKQRCLMFMSVEGQRCYTRFVKRRFKRIAKKQGGFYIGQKPVIKWLDQRFSSAYLRDPLMDVGLMTDTLETAVTWSNLIPVWKAAHAYASRRPKTLLMIHISHVYENGANLYFTFLSPMEKGHEETDFYRFHGGLVDTILETGGALSHHHGVGRTLGPRMESMSGKTGMESMRAVKQFFDPHNIMNPGGMLGLD